MVTRAALAALVAIGVISGSACTLPLTGPDPSRLMSDSQKAFDNSQSYHLKAAFKMDGQAFTLDSTVVHGVGIKASGTDDGAPFELIRTNGKTYVRSPQLFEKVDAKVAKIAADQWVLSSSKAGAADMDDAINPNRFSSFFGVRTSAKLDGEEKVNGVDTYRLTDSSGTSFIAKKDPHYPVRGVAKKGYLVDGKVAEMVINLDSFDAPATVQAPAKFLDFNDPKTLPARFSVQDFSFDSCNAQSCGGRATVTNEAGTGTGTMIFHLLRADGSEVGSCTAPVPELAYKQSVQVGCRVSGKAWTDYANSGAYVTYRGRAEVPNPLYD